MKMVRIPLPIKTATIELAIKDASLSNGGAVAEQQTATNADNQKWIIQEP